ncbi:MAG: VOC family protein [Candidatus Saccharimonadales bacterium]
MRFAPEVYTSKILESKAFYCDHLGFKVKMELEGFVVLRHAKDTAYEILFCVPDSPYVDKIFRPSFKGQGLIFQMEVDNAEAEYKRLKDKVPIMLKLVDEEINGKHFTVKDPNGILIDIVQYH